MLEEDNYSSAAYEHADMYIDDFVSSVNTKHMAEKLHSEICNMFRSGGLNGKLTA